jgi:hypothetical protein
MHVRRIGVLLAALAVAMGVGSGGFAAEKAADPKAGGQVMGDKMTGDKMMPGKMDAKMMRGAVGEQLKVAVQHAGLAQSATALAGVRTHLQHVVNCLEGSGGGMFKAAGGNPCQGKGGGILPDAASAKLSRVLTEARAALSAATAGLKATELAAAKTRAAAAHAALMKAEKSSMMDK